MRIDEMRQLFKDVHTEEDIKKILNEHEGLEAEIIQMDKANMAELSDAELDNVVGGMSGTRSIAMILASLTIISSSALVSEASGSFISPVTVSAAEMTVDKANEDIETEEAAIKAAVKEKVMAHADALIQEINDEDMAHLASGTETPEIVGNIIEKEFNDIYKLVKKIDKNTSDKDSDTITKTVKSVDEALKWFLKKWYKRFFWWDPNNYM